MSIGSTAKAASRAARNGARMREKLDGALATRMDVRVWLRLLSCATTVEKRLRRRLAEQFDTTLPRFDVMAALERRPDGITMGELSRALLVSNGNVTSVVRQLVANGFVVARVAPDDGRSQIVALTESGRSYFSALAAAHHAWIKSMFGGLSAADLAALYKLLDTVKTSIGAEGQDEQ